MNLDVKSLQQQLAFAQTRLQEYTDIIISQANELRVLRDNLCQNCKRRFTPSPESTGTAPSSVLIHSHSSPDGPTKHKPFWRRMLSQRSTKHPNLNLTPPSTQASNLTSASPPILKSSAIGRLPLETSKPATIVPISATETSIPSEITPEWLVEYEKTESRTVDVTFVRAHTREANVMSVRFSPDGNYFAASVAKYSGRVVIYGVESTMELVLREPSPNQNDKLGIWYLCFAPDGRHLATTGSDNRVRLWTISEKRVRSVYRMTENINTFDISPNGRFLACASFQGITMWRFRDGSKKIFRDSSTYAFSFVRFTPNGLYIVAVDFQNTLKIWNTRTGYLVARWTEHDENPHNGNGLRGRYHKSQRFWTVRSVGANTTEEIPLFTGHRRSNAVAVSPDGQLVASGSVDGNTHIWDSRDGLHKDLQQCTLLGHANGIVSLDFSPAGNYLAVGKGSHVSLWRYKHRAN